MKNCKYLNEKCCLSSKRKIMSISNYCIIFIYIFLASVNPTVFVSIHSHSHTRERVEDGAHSPRSHQEHINKKSESELLHEVMLGSAKEAEEFHRLPPDESKKRLRILLSKIDANNDHFVTPEELYAWIMKSFKKLSEEEAEDRFEETDVDQDGKITWKEQLLDSFGEDSIFEESHVDDAKLIKADQRLFQAADANHDGTLDKEEYRKFCSPEEYADMIPALIENTLEDKDLNKDGFIDFDEFIGGEEKMHDKSHVITERELFDSNYDKNKDGLLNNEEIFNWIVPNSSQIAAEETRHLMAAADDNHDYLLSFDEIIDNHDLFVGSEATDFGEHLHNIHHIIDEL